MTALQPYRGGNIALRALHDLDNMDKHKLIIPTLDASSVALVSGDFPPGGWPDELCPRCGTDLKPPKKDGEWVWRGEAIFDSSAPLAGEEVVPTLHHLAQTVDGIIDGLARVLAGANPNP